MTPILPDHSDYALPRPQCPRVSKNPISTGQGRPWLVLCRQTGIDGEWNRTLTFGVKYCFCELFVCPPPPPHTHTHTSLSCNTAGATNVNRHRAKARLTCHYRELYWIHICCFQALSRETFKHSEKLWMSLDECSEICELSKRCIGIGCTGLDPLLKK